MEEPSKSVVVQLLDSATGRPLQKWEHSQCKRLSIGRSADNDISISDPQVSRLHVELCFEEGGWVLVSHGRNGTWVHGKRVERIGLEHRKIFQLGSNGPQLQFFEELLEQSLPSGTLDNFDPTEFDFLNIDRQLLADEVHRIAESESFQRLKNQTQRQQGIPTPDISTDPSIQ